MFSGLSCQKTLPHSETFEQVDLALKHNNVSAKEFTLLDDVLRHEPCNPFARNLLAACYASTGYTGFEQETKDETLCAEAHPEIDARIERTLQHEGILSAETELRHYQALVPSNPEVMLARVRLLLVRKNFWAAEHTCDLWERSFGKGEVLSQARALIEAKKK